MLGTTLNLNSGGEGDNPPLICITTICDYLLSISDRARQYCVSTGGVAIPPYPSRSVFFNNTTTNYAVIYIIYYLLFVMTIVYIF